MKLLKSSIAVRPAKPRPTAPSSDCAHDGAESPPAAVVLENPNRWRSTIAYALLPGLALLLAAGAGLLKWHDASARDAQTAEAQSVRAATDCTIALLSYKPDTVERDLQSAKSRLTGTFLETYNSLTRDVVIPGAKQKQISTVATVPAASSMSATPDHAVVLLFVNQTVTVGQGPPTNTASSVRVTLDKVGDHWLISQFDPV